MILSQGEQKKTFFYLTGLTAAASETEGTLEIRSSEGFSEDTEGLRSYVILSLPHVYNRTLPAFISTGFIGGYSGTEWFA